jgi:adenylate cyclase
VRVVRFFGFVDLCGFTRFGDAHGDDAAVAVLTGFRSAVRGEASKNGVRVAKWLGDGAMFVSTEGEALVTTVLSLAPRLDGDGGLPVRVGVAGGPVILFEGDDYIGGPVNLAARLCDAAKPYEALVAADLAPLLSAAGPGLPDRRQVPGFAQPVDVVRLGLRDTSRDATVVVE